MKPIFITEGEPIRDIETLSYYVHAICSTYLSKDEIDTLCTQLRSNFEGTTLKVLPDELLNICIEFGLRKASENGDSRTIEEISSAIQKFRERFKHVHTLLRREYDSLRREPGWARLNEFSPRVKSYHLLDRSTFVGTAGNCLASEFTYRFLEQKFNFVVTEDAGPLWSLENTAPIAPARWGLITNTAAFHQLIEFAFGLRNRTPLIWTHIDQGKRIYLDPYRMHHIVESPEGLSAYIEEHRNACRLALEKCEIFIFLPHTCETWWLNADQSVLGHLPFNISHTLLEPRSLSVSENVRELQAAWILLKKYNSKVKLIAGVSPNPIPSTTDPEKRSLPEANLLTKSTLRIALEEFTQKTPDTYYFPCLEYVTYYCDRAFNEDNIHLNTETLEKVWELFLQMFLRDYEAKP